MDPPATPALAEAIQVEPADVLATVCALKAEGMDLLLDVTAVD